MWFLQSSWILSDQIRLCCQHRTGIIWVQHAQIFGPTITHYSTKILVVTAAKQFSTSVHFYFRVHLTLQKYKGRDRTTQIYTSHNYNIRPALTNKKFTVVSFFFLHCKQVKFENWYLDSVGVIPLSIFNV